MSPRPRLVIGMPEWDEDEPLPEPPDERAEPLPSRPAEKTRAPSGSPPYSPASVIDAWGREGPLVHEPTGLEALDTATGGGPPYGTRWYLGERPTQARRLASSRSPTSTRSAGSRSGSSRWTRRRATW